MTRLAQNPAINLYPDGSNAAAIDQPAYAVFNGRIALRNLNIGGVRAEVALWGRNLTDQSALTFPLISVLGTASNYIPARSYGLDLAFQF
jgi:iron complex outermembrane receptor protein